MSADKTKADEALIIYKALFDLFNDIDYKEVAKSSGISTQRILELRKVVLVSETVEDACKTVNIVPPISDSSSQLAVLPEVLTIPTAIVATPDIALKTETLANTVLVKLQFITDNSNLDPYQLSLIAKTIAELRKAFAAQGNTEELSFDDFQNKL